MVYAVYRRADGTYGGGVYTNWGECHSAIWNPDELDKIICFFDSRLAQGSYSTKKSVIAQRAMDYQYSASLISLSYMELAIMDNYFQKMGRRFGLLREFHENGIC